MKYLLIGSVVALLSILVGFIMDDWTLVYQIAGAVGIICLVWGALISGVFVSRDKNARNLASENRREREEKFIRMKRAVIIAIPNIAVAVIALILVT